MKDEFFRGCPDFRLPVSRLVIAVALAGASPEKIIILTVW